MKQLIFILTFLIGFQLTSQTLIPFRVNQLWGYSDTSGKLVIAPQFDLSDFYTKDIAFVLKDTAYYIINKKGNIISSGFKKYGSFVNGLCPIQNFDGSCYYINEKGSIAFEKTYQAAENFSEGLAVVSINKKLGIINNRGEWIREPNFDTSSIYYKSGFLLGLSKGQYFYIDKKGKTMHLPDSIQPGGIFSEGMAPVYVTKSRNSEGKLVETTYLEFIDTSGKIVLSGFYNQGMDYSEYITLEKEFRDGKAIIKSRNEMGWDYYFIDKNKKFSQLYAVARQLGDSLFLGAIGYYMSEIQLLDSELYVAGQFQSKPTQVGEYKSGLVPFRNSDGQWGYCNSNCQIIIEFKYSTASPFFGDYASVVYNGRQGVINKRGKEYFIDK